MPHRINFRIDLTMPGLPFRFAQRAVSHLRGSLGTGIARRVQAVLVGAGLGTLVNALAATAEQAGEPQFRLAMALVMVAAGALAFVLYAQQAQARRPSRSPVERRWDARIHASLLGCGLIGALHALPRVIG